MVPLEVIEKHGATGRFPSLVGISFGMHPTIKIGSRAKLNRWVWNGKGRLFFIPETVRYPRGATKEEKRAICILHGEEIPVKKKRIPEGMMIVPAHNGHGNMFVPLQTKFGGYNK